MSFIELSFCIPIMNRFDDIKATLSQNLEDNREAIGSVEFIIVCFDLETTVETWISANFKADLESGYLRFYRSNDLDSWHFGRAKNSFKKLMKGRIYASLDGDNFTGYRGGAHIIDVFKTHDYNCIFHQFQGDWGDGTCGRIALNRSDYIEIGYDNDFLPRQWDELDAMLSVMVKQRQRKYACYRGKSIIRKSQPFRRFLEENGLNPVVVELDGTLDPLHRRIGAQAVGRHSNSYVQDDPKLRHSSVFNHLNSYYKNTADSINRNKYVVELVEVQRKMVDEIDASILEKWFLKRQDDKHFEVAKHDLVLLSCVKDEPNLPEWYRYYKELGVTKFLLIDDHSKSTVIKELAGDDVFVWQPFAGKFRYSKAFWIEILLSAYCRENWCLTVDSDEYLSLPMFAIESAVQKQSSSRLRRFINVGAQKGHTHFCGFLLDLFPSAEKCINKDKVSSQLRMDDFTQYQYRPATLRYVYQKANTVRWSYGNNTSWAYRIDIRYRINRSFDSLRKFPIFQYRPRIHLNQGFHDLIIDGQKRNSDELNRSDLIPILHYKLHGLVASIKAGKTKNPDAYHEETRINLIRLQGKLEQGLQEAAISPFSYRYLSYGLIPTPCTQCITIRVIATPPIRAADEQYVERTGEILFVKSSQLKIGDVIFYGPSLDSAVNWVIKNTPYKRLIKTTDDFAVLSAMDA